MEDIGRNAKKTTCGQSVIFPVRDFFWGNNYPPDRYQALLQLFGGSTSISGYLEELFFYWDQELIYRNKSN